MNILVSPLPETIRVGETSMPIASGYRTGIQAARLLDSTLDDRLRAGALLRLYLGDHAPADAEAAIKAIMEFHRCGAPVPTGRRKKPGRLIDWDHDAGMILADFRREYSIDLADTSTRLHWWVFMAYFENLSASSQTKTAMYYRGANRPSDLRGAEAKRFIDMQKAYALPPRSVEEAVAREAAAWGDS